MTLRTDDALVMGAELRHLAEADRQQFVATKKKKKSSEGTSALRNRGPAMIFGPLGYIIKSRVRRTVGERWAGHRGSDGVTLRDNIEITQEVRDIAYDNYK